MGVEGRFFRAVLQTHAVMNDKESQSMSEIGQSEVRSVSCKVTENDKQNDRNNVSGLKELPTESLDTNSMKKTFKVFNISKTLSSKKSKTRIISSQNILPALSTPTKRKLIEEKTVQNLIKDLKIHQQLT